jgi:riboflavin synthase
VFTGIVREAGEILERTESEGGVTFKIGCGTLIEDLAVGHSISVDGVCLTVTERNGSSLKVDATPETLRRSSLGSRKVGDHVNLEPSLRSFDFLGGHLVQGHVDATGVVESIRVEGNSSVFRISLPPEVGKYCVMKGSVSLDGISLTISALGDNFMEVTIIPHTLEVTNMSELRVGDQVNLEADVISKYVESHVQRYLGHDNGSSDDADGWG